MQVSDRYAICLTAMTKFELKRLLPCRHLFHSNCVVEIINLPLENRRCPHCRQAIANFDVIRHKEYANIMPLDRRRIVECANRGENWKFLAESLGINYKTVYTWIRSGEPGDKQRGGYRHKSLTEEQIDAMISWIENNCDLSLKQVKGKVFTEFNISISKSTVSNYLKKRLFTVKKTHHMQSTMNTIDNKTLCREYIIRLNEYIREGKDLV